MERFKFVKLVSKPENMFKLPFKFRTTQLNNYDPNCSVDRTMYVVAKLPMTQHMFQFEGFGSVKGFAPVHLNRDVVRSICENQISELEEWDGFFDLKNHCFFSKHNDLAKFVLLRARTEYSTSGCRIINSSDELTKDETVVVFDPIKHKYYRSAVVRGHGKDKSLVTLGFAKKVRRVHVYNVLGYCDF